MNNDERSIDPNKPPCRGCCYCDPVLCDSSMRPAIKKLIKLYSQCFYYHKCKGHHKKNE